MKPETTKLVAIAALAAVGVFVNFQFGSDRPRATAAQTVDAQPNEEPMPIDLSRHQWKHRLILLFAPTPDAPELGQMLDAYEKRAPGVQERDLVIYTLPFEGEARRDGEPLPGADVAALADRFEVEEGFTYLLIGKDGTVKNRSDAVVDPDDTFARIDAMPMRQREMKQR